jgi:predicted tellurium resistance membrane protein TerC
VIFLAILTSKLPEHQRTRARRTGLILAAVGRIALLLGISWIIGLKAELFALLGHSFSGRDLILLGGGLFLIAKATVEIYAKSEGHDTERISRRRGASFASVMTQIVLMDLVFSLDSVITAVGVAKEGQLWVMVTAIVLAIAVMMIFAGPISNFVERHPSVKVLALAFLVLIGVVLVADGMGEHINRGYIYFAMAFSVGVELLQMRADKKPAPSAG